MTPYMHIRLVPAGARNVAHNHNAVILLFFFKFIQNKPQYTYNLEKTLLS